MARRRDPEDASSDGEDDPPVAPRRSRSSRRPPASHSKRSAPVRRWRTGDDEEEDDDELDSGTPRRGLFPRQSHPVYWRARDSLFFEPLVAVAIIVLMLVSLYAYTGNWPPVYVVESSSMQHGTTDIVGLINTGDLVLAQRLPTDQITPYVTGLQSGYSTYGEYGDVLLYFPNGQSATPIIHRALLYLEWDPVTSAYNATDLTGLRCGTESGAIYNTSSSATGCGVTDLTGTLTLYHVGWRGVTVSVDLSSSSLGEHSGFLTMGDNNLIPEGCTTNCVSGLPDQVAGLSELVEPNWIVGVARGMLPWFGAVKLALEGNAGDVPSQSWQFLGLTIVGLILLAFGIHYAFRAEGIEDQRRKDEEVEEAEAQESDVDIDEPGGGRGIRFLRAIRPWGRTPSDESTEETEVRHRPRTPSSTSRSTVRHRGRPSPKVRRASKSKRKDPDNDDRDD
jgi:signal peptidase I